MFKIVTTKDKTVAWPVKVEVAADGGKTSKFEFIGIFKLLSDDERDELVAAERAAANVAETDESQDAPGALPSAWKEAAADTLLKQMTGWKNVCDENGIPVDFSRDALLAGLRSAYGLPLLNAISHAIAEIQAGGKAKN